MSGSNHIPKEQGYEKNLYSRIVIYINNHLQESLSLKSIARSFNIGTTTLQQLFSSYGHKSVLQYIKDMRMRRAMELIIAGFRIKEVMRRTGYKYRSSFNRAFLKRYHSPPGHFRK